MRFERAAGGCQRQLEPGASAGEVLVELDRGLFDNASRVAVDVRDVESTPVVAQVEAAQPVGIVGDERERPDGAGDDVVAKWSHVPETMVVGDL